MERLVKICKQVILVVGAADNEPLLFFLSLEMASSLWISVVTNGPRQRSLANEYFIAQ